MFLIGVFVHPYFYAYVFRLVVARTQCILAEVWAVVAVTWVVVDLGLITKVSA